MYIKFNFYNTVFYQREFFNASYIIISSTYKSRSMDHRIYSRYNDIPNTIYGEPV